MSTTPDGGSAPWLRRGYDQFEKLVSRTKNPVVLLEGSRDISRALASKMEKLAASLMQRFPEMMARSGNADGSDQAWARGVNRVAPDRLQLVLPTARYQSDAIAEGNRVSALSEVGPDGYLAAQAACRRVYEFGARKGPEAFDPLPPFKKAYLERDALKVLGYRDYRGKQQRATAALFYINPDKKNGGGTGHTRRLCEAERVPYFLSDDWLEWVC